MYDESKLVRIAKRQNNKKRNFLIVNPLQGKHMPVQASLSLQMFEALADKIAGRYIGEKILFIGFAETATAIGAAVAVKNNGLYMQTTREQLENVDYLFFSEEHSHATEQKLVKDDIDRIYPYVDRIIFVEDEVSTGKTILNIIKIMKSKYEKKMKFSVMSLINGMNDENLSIYRELGIDLCYLVKTEQKGYSSAAEKFKGDGMYFDCRNAEPSELDKCRIYECTGCVDPRRLVDASAYSGAVDKLYSFIIKNIDITNYEDILVLGTEETMYPSLKIAENFEGTGRKAVCHSTTRSPIEASSESIYPLHKRYSLLSLYDKDRETYIYNLRKYDCVIIVTDAKAEETQGLMTLVKALGESGNDNINVFRWCSK